MVNDSAEQLTTVFLALADPTRRAILERLAHGEASGTELARPFSISVPAISKHLRVLKNADLILQMFIKFLSPSDQNIYKFSQTSFVALLHAS
jgi:DNA-binding transcriptional ArsR family regulator